MRDIDNSQDVISVEDITDRVEELRGERGNLDDLREAVKEAETDYNAAVDDEDETEEEQQLADELAGARKDLREAEAWADANPEDAEELTTLESLLDDMRGYGGNHQFEGDWYPGSLIRESYFTDYVEEMLKDIGDLPQDLPGYIAIDWDKTAENVKMDYSEVTYDGVEYLYR